MNDETKADAEPRWGDGVPWCQEECAQHDGKRCRLMGFRPGAICEPTVREVVEERDALRAQLAAAEERAARAWEAGRDAAAAMLQTEADAGHEMWPNVASTLVVAAARIRSLTHRRPPMPDLDLTLARRATEIPGWRWMPGMLQHDTDTGRGERRIRHGNWIAGSTYVPDCRDPATAGCLLALLGNDVIFTTEPDGVATVEPLCADVGSKWAPTLGEAIIHAAIAIGRWPGGTP